MKRVVAIVLALVLGAAALPAHAQPGAYAEGGQTALADWVIMDSRTHGTFYFAIAMRSVSPEGVMTVGVIGSGDCRVTRGKHWTMMSCSGSGQGRELELDQFEFDPALRSASLTMEARGFTNKAVWKGRGKVPGVGASVQGAGTAAGADAYAARMARVKGRILGKTMPERSWMGFSFLVEGAGAFAYADGRSRRSIEFGSDGIYTYSVRLRRPRYPFGRLHRSPSARLRSR